MAIFRREVLDRIQGQELGEPAIFKPTASCPRSTRGGGGCVIPWYWWRGEPDLFRIPFFVCQPQHERQPPKTVFGGQPKERRLKEQFFHGNETL